jgi:hypothetical protein
MAEDDMALRLQFGCQLVKFTQLSKNYLVCRAKFTQFGNSNLGPIVENKGNWVFEVAAQFSKPSGM